VFAGYLGIGGGIILNPILFMYFVGRSGTVDPVHVALGTSLAAAVFTTSSSTVGHALRGRWRPSAIPFLALGVLVASYPGSYLGANLPGSVLKRMFAVLLLAGAYRLFRGNPANRHAEPCTSPVLLFATGALAGMVGALMGIGGGIVMVPLMLGMLHFPSRVAAGTSSAVAIAVALLGALGYIINGSGVAGLPEGAWGYVHPDTALWLAAGTVPGAQVGAYLNRKWGGKAFRVLFGCVLVLVALKLVIIG
jgi:uncharacterized membrane protein YfcA